MNIAVHAFDTIPMFHLSVPLLVFAEVAELDIGQRWSTKVWSTTGAPVHTAEGILLGDIHGPEILQGADIIIFPS